MGLKKINGPRQRNLQKFRNKKKKFKTKINTIIKIEKNKIRNEKRNKNKIKDKKR